MKLRGREGERREGGAGVAVRKDGLIFEGKKKWGAEEAREKLEKAKRKKETVVGA